VVDGGSLCSNKQCNCTHPKAGRSDRRQCREFVAFLLSSKTIGARLNSLILESLYIKCTKKFKDCLVALTVNTVTTGDVLGIG